MTNEYTAGKSAVEYFRRHGTDEATLKKFSEIFETKKMAKSVKPVSYTHLATMAQKKNVVDSMIRAQGRMLSLIHI